MTSVLTFLKHEWVSTAVKTILLRCLVGSSLEQSWGGCMFPLSMLNLSTELCLDVKGKN